jgi:hypothetical protein
MRKQRRTYIVGGAVVTAVAIATTLAGLATAAGSVDKVTGTYSYTSTSGPKTVSINAHGTEPVKGTWSFSSPRRPTIGGQVTCLVVAGNEAWMTGTPTGSEFGAFFYVIDGGSPGTDDLVVTWIQDPGQPFAQLQEWCETQYTDVPIFPLDGGNVVIHSGS